MGRLTRAELTKWTDALRANPEQQIDGKLTSDGETGFCCLGKLCQVMGVEAVKTDLRAADGDFRYLYNGEATYLPDNIAKRFGSYRGIFQQLGMPMLFANHDAAIANDSGVSWEVIAEHFDKYYPCSDEVQNANS